MPVVMRLDLTKDREKEIHNILSDQDILLLISENKHKSISIDYGLIDPNANRYSYIISFVKYDPSKETMTIEEEEEEEEMEEPILEEQEEEEESNKSFNTPKSDYGTIESIDLIAKELKKEIENKVTYPSLPSVKISVLKDLKELITQMEKKEYKCDLSKLILKDKAGFQILMKEHLALHRKHSNKKFKEVTFNERTLGAINKIDWNAFEKIAITIFLTHGNTLVNYEIWGLKRSEEELEINTYCTTFQNVHWFLFWVLMLWNITIFPKVTIFFSILLIGIRGKEYIKYLARGDYARNYIYQFLYDIFLTENDLEKPKEDSSSLFTENYFYQKYINEKQEEEYSCKSKDENESSFFERKEVSFMMKCVIFWILMNYISLVIAMIFFLFSRFIYNKLLLFLPRIEEYGDNLISLITGQIKIWRISRKITKLRRKKKNDRRYDFFRHKNRNTVKHRPREEIGNLF
jgi:hypothetical protein